MLSKILIVDFEDSFTYNIASVLFEYCLEKVEIEVLSHEQFFEKNYFFNVQNNTQKMGVILGPGPGHPKEYVEYFSQINDLRSKENFFLMGICLGHQILGMMEGYEIDYCDRPIHGESVDFLFQNRPYKVQKYNSLCVKKRGETFDLLEGKNWISYQFHPESIGTTNNIDFFKILLNF